MRLKWLALLLAIAPSAYGQQLINCIKIPATPCDANVQVGTGKSGDLSGISFGKANANAIAFQNAIVALQNNSQPPLIAGTFTSAQVLAGYTPATTVGSVNTTDMGLFTSDGVRWLSTATPPIPPGAAILGYKKNVYTIFPVFADIAFSNILSRLYNGASPFGPSNPPSGAYSTALNGQLQISYPAGGPTSQASTLAFQRNVNSQLLPGNLGYLPYLLGSQGFCSEIAVTLSGNDSDNFFAFFLEPQEHNTTQNDHLAGDPTGYERWFEFDINENGHGTDFSGSFRGAAHSWVGMGFAHGVTFTGIPSGTSATLTAPWGGDTFSTWPLRFAVSGDRTATLTNGSTAVTWTGGAVAGESTTTASLGYTRTFVNNTQVAPLDYTSEHIFTGCYDPIGNTFAWWQDNLLQQTLTMPAANAFVKTLHYFPLIFMQSHGTFVGFTGTVRYISAWAP